MLVLYIKSPLDYSRGLFFIINFENMNSNIKVTILGNSAAIPSKGSHLSAQVIVVNGEYFLMDCGEGTQHQLINLGIKYSRIDNIFISHLHGDHFFGLIGLISTYHLLGREKELNIYAPASLEKLIRIQLEVAHTSLKYKLNFHVVDILDKQMVFENSKAIVYAFPLEHRVPTFGYIFKQPDFKPKIDKEFVAEFNPTVEQIRDIKSGEDFVSPSGEIIANEHITIPPKQSLSYAYCSDTRYNVKLSLFVKNVSVLYHEATFDNSLKDLAWEKYHSTAEEAARTASNANAGQLILGHFSARNSDNSLLVDEAIEVFPHTVLSEEGMEYIISN